jgi:hypothetical protein
MGKRYFQMDITMRPRLRATVAHVRQQRNDPMPKLMIVLIAMLAATPSAYSQEAHVGRYQMVAVPASESQTFPQTLLLDTGTGQTWILYHETGQAIQWVPLRFSAGKDWPTTPLPPSPDAVGVSH